MIVMGFPPASLSGHAKGGWRGRSAVTRRWREDARLATLAARPCVPAGGDIPVHFRFVPPDRRSDRLNFPNRIKPIADGIADALKVNDRRFLPSYEFAAPEPPGRIEITFVEVSG